MSTGLSPPFVRLCALAALAGWVMNLVAPCPLVGPGTGLIAGIASWNQTATAASEADLHVRAQCPCSCKNVPQAAGYPTVPGYALPSASPSARPPLGESDVNEPFFALARLAPTLIDHVPISTLL